MGQNRSPTVPTAPTSVIWAEPKRSNRGTPEGRWEQFGQASTPVEIRKAAQAGHVPQRGVFATLLSAGVLNVATLVGFITLFGIAVRNGILLASHYNRLLSEAALSCGTTSNHR